MRQGKARSRYSTPPELACPMGVLQRPLRFPPRLCNGFTPVRNPEGADLPAHQCPAKARDSNARGEGQSHP